MKKYLYFVLGLAVSIPTIVWGINISVPQATMFGDILRGNTNGTYTPVATSTLVSGFQTPWVKNIDGGGFNLSNAGTITGTTINATSTTATSTVTGNFAVNGTGLISNLMFGDTGGNNLFWTAKEQSDNTLLFSHPIAKAFNIMAGNVGIGTTSPYARLSVAGETVAQNFTATSTTATSTFSGGFSALADANIGSNSRWYQNGSAFMTSSTTAAGNLTFGYQTPGTAFDANGVSGMTAFGYQAMGNATSSVSNNTAFGYQAMKGSATKQSGSQNVAVGYLALSSNTGSVGGTAIGYKALNLTTGDSNTAVGASALAVNAGGNNNSGLGNNVLSANIGNENTAVGSSALSGNTSASFNVAIGRSALISNTTGASNTALGYRAGQGDNVTQDQRSVIDTFMTFLGYQSSRSARVASTTVLTNGTAIGKNAQVGCSNCLVLGGTETDAVNVGVGTTSPYAKLSIISNRNDTNRTLFAIASSTGGTATTTLFSMANEGTAYLSGNVGVGTTSPWRTLSVSGTVAMNGLTSSATGNALCITTGKEITDAGGGTCTPSSIRFKENVETLASGFALDELKKLTVVSFDYKDGAYSPEDRKGSYGMIAEDVEKIDPKLVDYGYDGKPLTLKFEKFIGLLVQAVQELIARVTGLEDKLNAQQMEINALKTRMNAIDGQSADTSFFNGKIDEVRIYNRALTAAEVLSLYKVGR